MCCHQASKSPSGMQGGAAMKDQVVAVILAGGKGRGWSR